jgi:hypothetical protein
MSDFNAILSAILASKGGSDFSSNTMDPIMQYLSGNFQQNPRFTIDQLYQRQAPNSTAALTSGGPIAIAVGRIRSGVPAWELWRDEVLREESGMTPEEWKSIVNSLADEHQKVKQSLLDQSLQQDVFQKAGMAGANETYLDRNEDGTMKFAPRAYGYAPQQFDELISALPAQQSADTARYAEIDKRYRPVPVTDEREKEKLLYDKYLSEIRARDSKKERTGRRNKNNRFDNYNYDVEGNRLGVLEAAKSGFLNAPITQLFGLKTLVDRAGMNFADNAGGPVIPRSWDENSKLQELEARSKASKEAKRSGSLKDARLDSIRLARANAQKAFGDRLVGSSADTQRRASDLTMQILASLSQQGATPLKQDILSNALLRRSTKNG